MLDLGHCFPAHRLILLARMPNMIGHVKLDTTNPKVVAAAGSPVRATTTNAAEMPTSNVSQNVIARRSSAFA